MPPPRLKICWSRISSAGIAWKTCSPISPAADAFHARNHGGRTDSLENGEHVYTLRSKTGRLMVFGWLAEEATRTRIPRNPSSVKQHAVLEFQTFSARPSVTWVFSHCNRCRKMPLEMPSLNPSSLPSVRRVLSALDAVKTVGFICQASVFEQLGLVESRDVSR